MRQEIVPYPGQAEVKAARHLIRHAVRRQQHTSRPAELEPAYQNGQHGEAPCEEAGEVQNRIPIHRTKQRPHAEEAPKPRPQVHDIRFANPDPATFKTAGIRQVLPETAVLSHDPHCEFFPQRRHHALDAADVAGQITPQQDEYVMSL